MGECAAPRGSSERELSVSSDEEAGQCANDTEMASHRHLHAWGAGALRVHILTLAPCL